MKLKNKLRTINESLFGNEDSVLLEEKVLLATVIIGMIASIAGGIMNLFLGNSVIAMLVPLVFVILLIILFYFIRVRKQYKILIFPITLVVFLGIGLIWIKNAGYNGTNTIVYLTAFVLALIVSPVSKIRYIYFYSAGLLLLLHFFQHYFPEKIVEYPNEGTRFIDTTVTVFYCLTFIYLIMTFLLKNYRNERQTSNERGKKLEELNTELKLSNASKDKLFSIIAHDLKNPFHTILGFSDLSLKKLKDSDYEKTEEYLEHIKTSANNTLRLLENLLAWSKTQTGHIKYKPESQDLLPVVEEITESLSSSSIIKNITLSHSISVSTKVFADRDILNTILRNLITNALKYTNPGGAVSISAIYDNHRAEVTVSDNGVGMDKEKIDLLFRIENDVSTKGTANEAGTGLGLLLCKEFIELHGGTINVESTTGKGSSFSFTLPYKN